MSSETCHQKVVPKGLSLDVGEFKPSAVKRDLIDFENRALCIQKADKLNHENRAYRFARAFADTVHAYRLPTARCRGH